MSNRWDAETLATLATALEVAAWAPFNQNSVATNAKIPWSVIHELRRNLEDLRVDWRSYKVEHDQRVTAATAAAAERRRQHNIERNIGLETYSQPGGDAAE